MISDRPWHPEAIRGDVVRRLPCKLFNNRDLRASFNGFSEIVFLQTRPKVESFCLDQPECPRLSDDSDLKSPQIRLER